MRNIIAITTFVRFVFLTHLITHRMLQKHFIRFQLIITRTMGII